MEDNSQVYRPSIAERKREDEIYQLFIGKVSHVDYERKVMVLQDNRTGDFWEDVSIIPANDNSTEATDVQMPEEGAECLACCIWYRSGFSKIAIVNWVASDTVRAIDAIATRPVEEIVGWSERKRGTFRKAYPGQKTTTNSSGFTSRIDEGWDYATSDMSRNWLNVHRREWLEITSRRVNYSDAGLVYDGPVERANASNIPARRLPDGSQDYVLYLQPDTSWAQRYQNGQQDLIPIVEKLERVQEFALDFAVPAEVLETDLMDKILGTNASPWTRTVVTGSPIQTDDQSFIVQSGTQPGQQGWDNPHSKAKPAVGPTLREGPTPRRRAYIIEKSEGTLVGYNRFDTSTYGFVLKPVLFPYTTAGRFGADVDSSYKKVNPSTDHVETRLAADGMMFRFPHEYNTTRFDFTKEGMISFEIGSTMPKENTLFDNSGSGSSYEHPHGAGRSLEGHLVGSAKLVIGKNRDEEDALDAQILGQSVLRLGADDTSLPDDRRMVTTQIRGSGDAVQKRMLQYWLKPSHGPGDAGSLVAGQKTGMENVSIRAAADGGVFLRLGARNPASIRRHLVNGYMDGQGTTPYAIGAAGRIDSKSPGRPVYAGSGDTPYQFHTMTTVGKSVTGLPPYQPYWSGDPTAGHPELHGLSLDFHSCADVFLRLGKNTASWQSLMMDMAGGLAAAIGQDKQGRSVTAQLDGGVEMTIGQNKGGRALNIEFNGDVDWTVLGNFHLSVTGDIVVDSTSYTQTCKTDLLQLADKIYHKANTALKNEASVIDNNQGAYSNPDPNN